MGLCSGKNQVPNITVVPDPERFDEKEIEFDDSDSEFSRSANTIWEEDKISKDPARMLRKWSKERVREEFEKNHAEIAEYLFKNGVKGKDVSKSMKHLFREDLEKSKKFSAEEIEDFSKTCKELIRRYNIAATSDESNRSIADIILEKSDMRNTARPVGLAFRSVMAGAVSLDEDESPIEKLKKCIETFPLRNFEQITGAKILCNGENLLCSSSKHCLARLVNGKEKAGELRHAILGSGAWSANEKAETEKFDYATLPGEVQFCEKRGKTRCKYTVAILQCTKRKNELLFCACNLKPLVEEMPEEHQFEDPLRPRDTFSLLASFRRRSKWTFCGDFHEAIGNILADDQGERKKAVAQKELFLKEMSQFVAPAKAVDVECVALDIFVYMTGEEAVIQAKHKEACEGKLKLPSFENFKLKSEYEPSERAGNYCNTFNRQYEELVPFKQPSSEKSLFMYLIFRQMNRKLAREVTEDIKGRPRDFFSVARRWTMKKNSEVGFKLRAAHMFQR